MRTQMIRALAALVVMALLASAAQAQPTQVTVRAQAMDAKFIGDHMGGVAVTLTDARSGKVLAKGTIKGGTGDTARIMRAPRSRGTVVSDAGAAGYVATLDIHEPTLVRVEAVGPLGKPGASITVTSSLWVIPGHDITGDGLVLTFPGLVVEPEFDAGDGAEARIRAKISPMCGCPIDAGGLWDAANYTVTASLKRDGRVVERAPLRFAGKTGEFEGVMNKPRPGRYTVQIVVTDAKSPNTGVAEQAVRIAR